MNASCAEWESMLLEISHSNAQLGSEQQEMWNNEGKKMSEHQVDVIKSDKAQSMSHKQVGKSVFLALFLALKHTAPLQTWDALITDTYNHLSNDLNNLYSLCEILYHNIHLIDSICNGKIDKIKVEMLQNQNIEKS